MPAVLSPAPRRRADILFTLAVLGGLYAAYVVRHVLLIIYVSALFAVVLSPVIQLIARIHIGKWRPNHGIALLILIVGLATLLTLFLIFALPPIFHDARSMASEWPKRLIELTNKARSVPFLEGVDMTKLDDYIAAASGGGTRVARRPGSRVSFARRVSGPHFALGLEDARAIAHATSLGDRSWPPRRAARKKGFPDSAGIN